LKKGSLPKWAPKGIISRAESWILEESEVDVEGKVVRCRTRNLDHVKVMRVEETVMLTEAPDGKTLQTNEARIISRFGWGLAKSIENHGLARFKANLQRSREGVSLILGLLRQSRLQPMTLASDGTFLAPLRTDPAGENSSFAVPDIEVDTEIGHNEPTMGKSTGTGPFTKLKSWFGRG